MTGNMESEFGFDSAADKDWDAGMDSDSSSGKDPKGAACWTRNFFWERSQ